MIKLIDSNVESKAAIEAFINRVKSNGNLQFSTSGTTGTPKHITHSVDTITKHVKEDLESNVWGLTYDHTKIAGSQVIVQALKNKNTLVNLYRKSTDEVYSLINEHKITHLSGTPTFYRLNFRDEIFTSVKQVTLGGEAATEDVIKLVTRIFPNANITNIYALTEFGSVLASSSHLFKLSERTSKFIKLTDTVNVLFDGKWHDTGDVIEKLENGYFRIVGRESSMINVGGHKVNPYIIEDKLNSFDGITSSKVYGKENSLTGNIVAADIVLSNDINIKEVKRALRDTLKPYEVPRIINEVDSIEINSTGKISRKNG